MPKIKQLNIADIKLDLNNFRMMPQKDEKSAVSTMIAIKPERFFGVLSSIVDDEYTPTENIIIHESGGDFVAKEGNRRIASLKLVHGILNPADFPIPDAITNKIKSLNSTWKGRNKKIPCMIFSDSEVAKVDKIVSLTHGKGEKASRDPWTSVATARHNRDHNGAKEHGLNLLEKYLQLGKNLTGQQKERWSGDYNLTVLNEALKHIPTRIGLNNIEDVPKKYPSISNRDNLENLLRDIGLEIIGFKGIRDKNKDFLIDYGFAPLNQGSTSSGSGGTSVGTGSSGSGSGTGNGSGGASSGGTGSTSGTGSGTGNTSTAAKATNDQRHVKATLKKFSPTGNRPKVVTLKNELLKLNIKNNPIAFCFILRSMFEISAKEYCNANGLPTTKSNGREKSLKELLGAVTNHLTAGNSNTALVKTLHGAYTEISSPNRILSVTSMNQLVHNTSFSVQPHDVCTLFSNIYPLLEAMN